MSDKERAKARAQSGRVGPGQKKDERWHFGVTSQFGNLSMGSGDKPVVPMGRNARSARTTGKLVRNGPGAISQSNRELIGDVVSSQAFTAVQYRIQPAAAETFPWLSSIATKYQKWRCRGITLEYVPTVSEYAPAGRQGRIVLAANYDAMDAILENIQQAENIRPNVAGVPNKPARVSLDPDMVTAQPLLVRNGVVQPGMALSQYDGGVFYVAVDGIDGTVTDGTKLGELFVSYVIDFFEPIIGAVQSVPSATHSSWIQSQWDVTTSFALDSTYRVFPDLVLMWNGCGLTLDGAGGITFQPGRYLITLGGNHWLAASGLTGCWVRAKTGATVNPRSLCAQAFPAGTTGFSLVFTYVFTCTAPTTVVFEQAGTGTASAAAVSSQWPAFLCQTV